MLAYRLIASSPSADPPAEWSALPDTAGRNADIRFGRYQDGLWNAQTVGTSPVSGEVFSIALPGPQHEIRIEERGTNGPFVDTWRITFQQPIGLSQLWVLVRFVGKGERINERTFVVPDPVR